MKQWEDGNRMALLRDLVTRRSGIAPEPVAGAVLERQETAA